MVRAWYMDDNDVDQRLGHRKKSSELLSTKDLYAITGVEHFKVDHEHHLSDTTLKELKENRGCTYDDEIICSQKCLCIYEEKIGREM